jgi:ankyrin repeat protein
VPELFPATCSFRTLIASADFDIEYVKDARFGLTLILPVIRGLFEEVDLELILHGKKVALADQFGETPVCVAFSLNLIRTANAIITQAAADINGVLRSLMGFAACSGHIVMVRAMLIWEMDPNRLNTYGWTARTWAELFGHGRVVKLRYKNGGRTETLPKDRYRIIGPMLVCM